MAERAEEDATTPLGAAPRQRAAIAADLTSQHPGARAARVAVELVALVRDAEAARHAARGGVGRDSDRDRAERRMAHEPRADHPAPRGPALERGRRRVQEDEPAAAADEAHQPLAAAGPERRIAGGLHEGDRLGAAQPLGGQLAREPQDDDAPPVAPPDADQRPLGGGDRVVDEATRVGHDQHHGRRRGAERLRRREVDEHAGAEATRGGGRRRDGWRGARLQDLTPPRRLGAIGGEGRGPRCR